MIKKLFILFIITTVSFGSIAGDKDKPLYSSKLSPMKIRKRNARPDIPGTFLIELGWNILQDNPEAMEIATFGSRTLNLYYFYNIELPIAGGRFELMPGIGLGLDRYKFDEDVTLVESGGSNSRVSVDSLELDDVQKSMLITNYLDIPVELRFYSNPNDKRRSFKVGVGFKAGMRLSSHTKIKYEDDDETVKVKNKRDFGLNRFRYGVTGRIGVGGFNVFYYQSLSDLFESGEGPLDSTATNITVGVSFTGF